MKVNLIVLPQPYIAHPMKHQPLGILYLAAAIEQKGYEVIITDLRIGEEIPKADVYGIGARTPDYKTAVRIAIEIKVKFGKPVILGGVHCTAVPDSIDYVFDSMVLGEGELAILDILKDIENGELKKCYKRELIADIDTIPFPARHLMSYDGIVSRQLLDSGEPATSIITSRGCRAGCLFCASKLMWTQKVRYGSIQRTVIELFRIMETYNIRHFKFQDDTLTLSKKRLLALCEAIKPLKIEWMANARVDTVDVEMLSMMKEAGCSWVEFGIETASQTALNILHKGTTIERGEKAIKDAKSVGLKVKALFMIGLPGEDNNIGEQDIEFLKRTQPDRTILATFCPLPGCAIYNEPKKFGMEILTKDFDEYLTNLGLMEGEEEKGFIYTHPIMSREEMVRERGKVLEFIGSRK